MGKKILLVDDDWLVLKAIDKYLSSCGYNIEAAQSGNEALEKIEKESFDLIISDVRMPGMDGVETLKRIRESASNQAKEKTPVIIMTGYVGRDEIYQKAKELGVTECIYKPFEVTEFIEAIKRNLKFPPQYQKEILIDYKALDKRFISLVENFKKYLQEVKGRFDEFDKNNKVRDRRIDFLEQKREKIFENTSNYLKNIWESVKGLNAGGYNSYAHYLRENVNCLFIDSCEINNYIFKKPLGYPGDFVMMNYIYDYHKNAYLGETTYEMLLNHFACNTPISNSNIKRKEYFKEKMISVIGKKREADILSVGSGPARELVELLKEGGVRKNFTFHCLDFERKALDFVKEELNKISLEKKSCCKVNYIHKNYIIDLVRNKSTEGLSKGYDLIYCSGVYDYLKDRIATSLINILFNLLNKEGALILCAANNKDAFYRVAYEMMGDWVFSHRDKDEVVKWLKGVKNRAEFKFEKLSETNNYFFLSIKKP